MPPEPTPRAALRPVLALALLLACLAAGPAPAQETVRVDPDALRQTIRGWGVSLCWWANIVGGWPAKERDRLVELLAVDVGMNVFRFNIGGGENPGCPHGPGHFRADGGLMPGYRPAPAGPEVRGSCDLSGDARQIAVMDALARRRPDALTVLFSNSPPWWMTRSLCAAGAEDGGPNLPPGREDDFADYLASATAALRARNPAWNILAVEAFNEPASPWWKAGGKQEGCRVPAAQQAAVVSALRSQLDARDLRSIAVVANDCSAVPETLDDIATIRRDHPGAHRVLGAIHTHSYKGTPEQKRALAAEAASSGLPVWQSETGPLGWRPADGKSRWQGHYLVARRLIEDLRDLRCEVWCDWQLASVDEGWGMVRFANRDPAANRDWVKTRGYHCRKQVVNFIKPGFRIIATDHPATLGALSPDARRLVLLVANAGETPAAYRFDLSGFAAPAACRAYRTSGPEGGEDGVELPNDALRSDAGALLCDAPPFSLTTLVMDFPALP